MGWFGAGRTAAGRAGRDEFAVICQLLLNGGTYGDVRLLSPSTVQAMTTNRLVDQPDIPDAVRRSRPWGTGLESELARHFSKLGRHARSKRLRPHRSNRNHVLDGSRPEWLLPAVYIRDSIAGPLATREPFEHRGVRVRVTAHSSSTAGPNWCLMKWRN